MAKVNLSELKWTHFPSGRTTRIIASPDGPLAPQGFSLGRSVLEPGGSVPAHHHSNEEIYHIISGRGHFRIGAVTFAAQAGDSYLIPPDTEHELVNGGDQEMELLWVYAPAGIMQHWADELETGHE